MERSTTSVTRRVLRWLKRSALALLALLLLYGAAVVLLPLIPANRDWRPAESGVEIAVLSNGVHTDLVLPTQAAGVDWTRSFPHRDFAAVDSGFEWISFGWGSRAFYLETPTWADLKLSTALLSVSGFADSAMHVTWRWQPEATGCPTRRFRVTEEQYRKLADEVLAAFAKSEVGAVRRIDAPGYTPYDRFYESLGSYSAIHTCNEWTGARLRSIGVKQGCWTPWATDVLRHLPE